jgi:hypothetical protein
MPKKRDGSKLSLSKNKEDSASSSLHTSDIQDGDLASTANQSLLASQLRGMLTSDESLINTLADTIANLIINSAELLKTITDKLKTALEDDVTQHVYKAVSMDVEKQNHQLSTMRTDQEQLTRTISHLEEKLDEHEQYSRRNCLLIHGLPEKTKEDTNETAINTIKTHLNLTVTDEDIDRSHRLGKKRKPDATNDKQSRPIIVKFTRYAVRSRVFKAKSGLKGTGVVITENLTAKRMQLLERVKNDDQVATAWTTDGRVQCITFDDKFMNIKCPGDLNGL